MTYGAPTALLIVLVGLSGGCASSQKVIEIQYTKGCRMDIRYAGMKSATEITDTIDIKDCEISGDTEAGSKR